MIRRDTACLNASPERKLIYHPKPTTIWLTSGNFSRDISIAQSGRGECEIFSAQCRSLYAGMKLRPTGQELDEHFSNSLPPNRDLAVVAVSHYGIRLIEGHEAVDVTRLGTL